MGRDVFQVPSRKAWNKLYGSREKNTINIFDKGFKGTSIVISECLCGTKDFRMPRMVEYVQAKPDWRGITVFTDKFIHAKLIRSVKSAVKIALPTEPQSLQPQMYLNLDACVNEVDLILTHDRDVLEKYPEKSRFFIASCPIVAYQDVAVHPKSKLCSFIFSNKTQLEGHKLRHQIYQELKDDPKFSFIDFFGDGVGKHVNEKIETLKNYAYSIVIENNKKDYYYTEKIFDAFSTGNIPIFWGTEAVKNTFDPSGIEYFNTIDELKKILLTISMEKYQSSLPAVHKNFNAVQYFMDPDDLLLETILSFLKEKKIDRGLLFGIL